MNRILVIIFLFGCLQGKGQESWKDVPFIQEYHEPYPVNGSQSGGEVRSVAIDASGNLFIATAAGLLTKPAGQSAWHIPDKQVSGPCYTVITDIHNRVWIGGWNGLYRYESQKVTQVMGTSGPISVLCSAGDTLYALGPGGAWLLDSTGLQKMFYPFPRSVRSAVPDGDNGLWVASDVGLYHATAKGMAGYADRHSLLSAYVRGLAMDSQARLWAVGLGGVNILQDEKISGTLTPAQGCPSIYVNCVKRAPDGTMWIGTRLGLVRYETSGSHSLLFSRRWLLDDEVQDIVFDVSGNAWIATHSGVSCIRRKFLTLKDKQDYFYEILMKRHIRTPWIAGQCHLSVPGDTLSWHPEDDDNDGEYTANYLAMESFRYAATGSEDARMKAGKAFRFLKKLQEVTGGDGYFARTIVPVGWPYPLHDSNQVYTPQQLSEELVKEPRFKPVGNRWRKSADGQWLWKGDASSDEWCGHMMGYFFYYQLAADKKEQALIRKHVSLLVDHLINHNFNMMDVDGTHTRWSVWSPDQLNRDPEWRPDRAQNSLEILTFLKLAHYMTGNEKYQLHYDRLIREEHYLDNIAEILDQDPAWFIYFDSGLQAYLFPLLLECEKDPSRRGFYSQLLEKWLVRRKDDHNPLFNFLYCYATGKKTELKESVEFLRNTPLDLVDWTIDHTRREDVRIVHSPVLDEWQVDSLPPASIRATVRWDKNPWAAVSGYPDKEREPVFWLLPYWMGRYLRMIDSPN